MITARRLGLVLATVVATALAGPAAAASAAQAPAPIAALGDSYSSGEGAPPFDPAAGACDRSPLAWPELVGTATGRAVVNLACSGAKTKDVVAPFGGQIAQTEALAALTPRPGVVTITIGGNDAGFGPVLATCLATDCRGAVAASDVVIATVLPGRLAATYRAVQAAAPGARLVVVGYPRLVPARQRDVTGCPWLTGGERKALNQAAELLDFVTRVEAWRAHATFVDAGTALAGHELCSQDPWLVSIGQAGAPVSSYAHPDPDGQAAIAARVTAALAG